jgi:hypothetical protein
MKKFFLPVVLVLLFAQTGCTKSVRYSAEEIRDYPPSVQEHIKKGEIAPGMTMAQVRYSWGSPDLVRVLAADEKGREKVEWTYTRMQVLKTRLVFTNGSLTEIVSTEPGIVKDK